MKVHLRSSVTIASVLVVGVISSPASAGPTSFMFENFGPPAPSFITTNGDAAFVNDVLRLTPDEDGKAGSAFLNGEVFFDEHTSFSSTIQFRIHGVRAGGPDGADGLVFIVQNDPRGSTAVGDSGSGLGFGFLGFSGAAIQNSVGIAFDTFPFQLSSQSSVELLLNGSLDPVVQSVQDFSFASGDPLTAWVDYDGTADFLEVFLSSGSTKPAVPVLTASLALNELVGSRAFFGFSGATGARFNIHDIRSWQLQVVQSVPQPSTLFLLTLGGVGLAVARLRSRTRGHRHAD